MKRRKTVDRWIADIFKDPDLTLKADALDRRLDNKVGAQMKHTQAITKTPETDWRKLMKQKAETQ